MSIERKFQTFVKAAWHGYSTQIHPGLGSDLGVPDLFLLASFGLLPCELKIGSINDGLLCVSAVRPAQIQWHHKINKAGQETIFMVGVPQDKNKWRIFLIDGITIQGWDSKGFTIEKDAIEIDPANMNWDVEEFVESLN